MSTPQSAMGVSRVPWINVLAALLFVVAAVACLAAIPFVFSDPDASQFGASSSLLTAAGINAGLGAAAFFGRRYRSALIVAAVGALAVGLFILDGAMSFNTHPSAPQVLPMLFWAALGADLLAAATAAIAAIVMPRGRA